MNLRDLPQTLRNIRLLCSLSFRKLNSNGFGNDIGNWAVHQFRQEPNVSHDVRILDLYWSRHDHDYIMPAN